MKTEDPDKDRPYDAVVDTENALRNFHPGSSLFVQFVDDSKSYRGDVMYRVAYVEDEEGTPIIYIEPHPNDALEASNVH